VFALIVSDGTVDLAMALSKGEKIVWRFIRFLLILGLGLVVLLMLFEEKFIYFPWKHPRGMWEFEETASEEGQIVPSIEDCRFVTRDGLELHGWYCKPGRLQAGSFAPLDTEVVFLFFHGNAGNITFRYDIVRMFMSLPVCVFIIDYRGYGKSQGRPSEKGLYLDAQASWDYLVEQRRMPPNRIILFGKSLGGAVAIDLATRVHAAGLIVQSSFTSIPDMARTVLPLAPSFLVRTKMASINKITRIECPKLFIHSPADEVVPYKLGRRLFEAAGEPKQFHEVPGAPHNETYLVGGQDYLDAIRLFVQSCTPGQSSSFR
jgi:fermentation-respiration switch protein FrsA (DUF1100 family)